MTAIIISLVEYRRRRAIDNNPWMAAYRFNMALIGLAFCWWEEIAR